MESEPASDNSNEKSTNEQKEKEGNLLHFLSLLHLANLSS